MPSTNIPYQAALVVAECARQVAFQAAATAYRGADVSTWPTNQKAYDSALRAAEKAYVAAVIAAADANGETAAAAESRNRLDWLNRRG